MNRLARSSLQPTLQNAFRHPYYARHWGQSVVAKIPNLDVENCRLLLRELPSTPKSALLGDLPPLPLAGDQIVSVGHTTGTTGQPHKWYLTEMERLAWTRITEGKQERESNGQTRLGIRVNPTVHGLPNPRYRVGDRTYYFDCSVRDDAAFGVLRHLLSEEHVMPGFESRVTELMMPPRILVSVTEALTASGVHATDLGVTSIALYGGYCNTAYKDLFKEYWDITPRDVYSTSEVIGGGVICPRCGYIYFPPHIIPQVLKFETDTEVQEGCGALAMTSLLPFNSAQPLIKFTNGDIGEVLSDDVACCSAHRGGIRVIGRVATSIFLDKQGAKDLLVSSHEIHDTFFSPVVDRERTVLDALTTLKDAELCGLPRVGVPSVVRYGSSLDIRFAPRYHPEDSASMLSDRLISRGQRLKTALDAGAVQLSVVADQSVRETLKK